MLSKTHFDKKLREFHLLKHEQNLNAEELTIQKETHYKKTLEKGYGKTLEVLPDEVQRYIWEFVDNNTRLNFFRSIYTYEFVNDKLSALEHNRLIVKKLYSCFKYVERISRDVLNNEECKRYKPFTICVDLQYFLRIFDEYEYMNNKYISVTKILKSIIVYSVKYYTEMYNQTKNIIEIQENETNMLKLFIRISSI
jgi:hypothetical protein